MEISDLTAALTLSAFTDFAKTAERMSEELRQFKESLAQLAAACAALVALMEENIRRASG